MLLKVSRWQNPECVVSPYYFSRRRSPSLAGRGYRELRVFLLIDLRLLTGASLNEKLVCTAQEGLGKSGGYRPGRSEYNVTRKLVNTD